MNIDIDYLQFFSTNHFYKQKNSHKVRILVLNSFKERIVSGKECSFLTHTLLKVKKIVTLQQLKLNVLSFIIYIYFFVLHKAGLSSVRDTLRVYCPGPRGSWAPYNYYRWLFKGSVKNTQNRPAIHSC